MHPYDSGTDPKGPSNPPPSRIAFADDDDPPPYRSALIVDERPAHLCGEGYALLWRASLPWWRRAWMWLRGRR